MDLLVLATMVAFVEIQSCKLLVANAALAWLLFTVNQSVPRELVFPIGRVRAMRTFVPFAGSFNHDPNWRWRVVLEPEQILGHAIKERILFPEETSVVKWIHFFVL